MRVLIECAVCNKPLICELEGISGGTIEAKSNLEICEEVLGYEASRIQILTSWAFAPDPRGAPFDRELTTKTT